MPFSDRVRAIAPSHKCGKSCLRRGVRLRLQHQILEDRRFSPNKTVSSHRVLESLLWKIEELRWLENGGSVS